MKTDSFRNAADIPVEMTWAMLQVHWDGQIAYHQLISATNRTARENETRASPCGRSLNNESGFAS
ncbi:hypothetical protein CORC01_05893 [Colletotrichum orchidophilum]|uniref:Uncharacterized protein n=1 Tax=Colletotrichum orchidophilum TaxID=1209926 RepID=A0A1G4BBM4_9PEZI|nr:uncharacterized protein CORC01_05893 [Colletotrichum orchidophilum]OHE98804.1 hypothetical protein CORC01_05893 [Colletotrichum orchidophilum]